MPPPLTNNLSAGLVWFRRDLRVYDQHALYSALKHCQHVYCAFVFDTQILAALPRQDRRVEFIQQSLVQLDSHLKHLANSDAVRLITLFGEAQEEIPRLAQQLGVQAVFINHDDEPASLARDKRVRGTLAAQGVSLFDSKDHVIFERSELLTQSGTAYGVFTPYKNSWLKKISPADLAPFDPAPFASKLAVLTVAQQAQLPQNILSLKDIGFEPTNLSTLGIKSGVEGGAVLFKDFLKRMDNYHETRDYPAVKGPSYLGVHLRFGTVSIRALAKVALEASRAGSNGAAVWLSELIWRDFYAQILHHYPRAAKHAFKPEYDLIQWETDKAAKDHFKAWCEGRTGFPVVDAAMRQINATGYMHNRLRMIAASFLVKDLGIDWRWGEAYFAKHLLDFDLASNNGGWQWASSSGCDAQPYFRIFNPVTQSERFDPKGAFIQRYVPELKGLGATSIHAPWSAPALELASAGVVLDKDYPSPLVDHAKARERTLMRYSVVKSSRFS